MWELTKIENYLKYKNPHLALVVTLAEAKNQLLASVYVKTKAKNPIKI